MRYTYIFNRDDDIFSNALEESEFSFCKLEFVRIICWMLQFQSVMDFPSVGVRDVNLKQNHYVLISNRSIRFVLFCCFLLLNREILRRTKPCWCMVQARKDCNFLHLIFFDLISNYYDYEIYVFELVWLLYPKEQKKRGKNLCTSRCIHHNQGLLILARIY